MKPSELRAHVTQRGSYFFRRDTMALFGDTMTNYGVRDAGNCWELYRKLPVKHGLQSSAYFDKETFKQVFLSKQENTK